MSASNISYDLRRRDVFSFVLKTLKPLLKLTNISLFKQSNLEKQSAKFSEIYSHLWDFAEHSISHQEISLPSALSHEGPISRINNLLSELYGARYSSLSFGGSSGALLTLLTAVFPKLHPNRNLILFDDVCHQSAIGGLVFGRWEAVRLIRDKHPSHQTVSPLTLETVKACVERHGSDNISAILLVLPSYDGFRSPSEDKKIYAYAKSQEISVIVDGAWDAVRFRQSKAETPALSSICDVWITSPHKRGLTPSSLGCMLTENETIARLWDEALDLGFRSSSVSFVECMIAEHRLTQIVSGEWDNAFDQAERAAQILNDRIKDIHPDIYRVKAEHVGAETNDPTHILLSTDKIFNLDARDWADTLANSFGIDVEKATATTLLLLCGSPQHLTQMDDIIQGFKSALTMTLTQKETSQHGR